MSSGNSSLGIIVGIDDSPAAQVAVRWAARDAELRKIPLTLVHAVSPEVATWLEVPLPPGVLRWQQDHGRHLIDDALKVVEQASLRAGPPTVHSEIVPAAAVPTLVIGRWGVHQEAMMNLAIWHPRKVQSATIYQVTDRSHDGRTARVPGDEITSTVSGWLSELGTQSPLADELARAVRIGDWPAAYAIGEHLSVEIAVAV
ncbi:Universal stress protein family [Mycobacterium tuberculosis]|nr:Universal stress protein family [Mycobacterium tuberculosis]CNH65497.1 Universal stress protein family [Mycobacterium tuberculosis]COV75670.1 Universal stress protein family [Mycobacterium tuberculosis]